MMQPAVPRKTNDDLPPSPEVVAGPLRLRVSVAAQTLEVLAPSTTDVEDGSRVETVVLRRYPVSTSRYGLGTEPGSLRTPLGRFRVGEKIGADQPLGTIFRSREPLLSPDAADSANPGDTGAAADLDLVLTRILWLEGLEAHNANTRERYIYIHGTNHEGLLGQPASHGCVRMANADVTELFELIPTGAEVSIEES